VCEFYILSNSRDIIACGGDDPQNNTFICLIEFGNEKLCLKYRYGAFDDDTNDNISQDRALFSPVASQKPPALPHLERNVSQPPSMPHIALIKHSIVMQKKTVEEEVVLHSKQHLDGSLMAMNRESSGLTVKLY
jgi:hypothetical protein